MNKAFIRVPKTGTTSLINGIREAVDSPSHPCLTRAHDLATTLLAHDHGHDFITMMRDPLQTSASCYYFVKNRLNIEEFDPSVKAGGRSGVLTVHADLIETGVTLEEYLLQSPANDFFGKFFGPLQPADCAFVGSVDDMVTSFKLLTAITGIPSTWRWSNKNPKRPATLQPYYVSPEVTAAFKERNALEYELYTKGLEQFAALKKRYQ